MTTTVKVHVGGKYRTTVTQRVDGAVYRTEVIEGPNKEMSFNNVHDKLNLYEVQEEQIKDE